MIVKLENSKITLSKEILKNLALKEGDYLDCIEFQNTIHLLPIRLPKQTAPLKTDLLLNQDYVLSNFPPEHVYVTLFREFNVTVNGKFFFIQNKKAKELLSYLLVHNGIPYNKSALAETLWPQTPYPQAMDNLYKVIRFLEKTPPLFIYFPLLTSRGKIQLDISKIQCDVYLFEQCYQAQLTKQHNIEETAKAVELYAGPLLYEEYYDWSTSMESYYEVRYIQMLESLIAFYKHKNNDTLSYYYRQKLNLHI